MSLAANHSPLIVFPYPVRMRRLYNYLRSLSTQALRSIHKCWGHRCSHKNKIELTGRMRTSLVAVGFKERKLTHRSGKNEVEKPYLSWEQAALRRKEEFLKRPATLAVLDAIPERRKKAIIELFRGEEV